MRRQPKSFDALYVNMVAAGEAGGILDTILKRLAVYIEKNVKLKGQVKSAMIYPTAVLTIAALVVAVILWKVIPTFAQLFAGLGAELPLPTRVVIWMSNTFIKALPFMVVGIGIAAFAIRAYYKTYRGRRVIDGLLLRLPILGMILRKIAVARFCRTLSTLMSSGVPILDGLDITARTSGNAIIEDAIMVTRESIERGETVSAPLEKTKVFPSMVTQMINVGETTGALDAMLSKIADFYEEEVDTAVAGLMTLLEPVMISILGVIVGGIVHLDVHADLQADREAGVAHRDRRETARSPFPPVGLRPLRVAAASKREPRGGGGQKLTTLVQPIDRICPADQDSEGGCAGVVRSRRAGAEEGAPGRRGVNVERETGFAR